jgi:hypothetical protein
MPKSNAHRVRRQLELAKALSDADEGHGRGKAVITI